MVHIKVIWYLCGNIWNTFYHTVDAFYGEIFHMCIFVPDLIEWLSNSLIEGQF